MTISSLRITGQNDREDRGGDRSSRASRRARLLEGRLAPKLCGFDALNRGLVKSYRPASDRRADRRDH